MKLKRYEGNPILSANPAHEWENLIVCNPAVIYENGIFHMLYRAAGNEPEHHIHIGKAESRDGFHFERVSDQPVITPTEGSFDAGGCEDPRVVKFGSEYYVTYAFRPYPAGQYWKNDYDKVSTYEHDDYAPICLKENVGNTALAISKDMMNFKKIGRLTESCLDDRDVILFPEKIEGKFWMLHRPKNYVGPEYGTEKPAIWIKSSDDLMTWNVESHLLMKGVEPWEQKIGGNTPPIKTKDGWLVLYHGIDEHFTYRIGAVILDLNDPTKILYRTQHFILEPETKEEKEGVYKWGVVFPTGAVVVDETLYVYYGASDQWINVATCNLYELLNFIKEDSKK